MEENPIHEICRERLENTHEAILTLIEREKQFILKMFNLQRYYLNNTKTSFISRKEHFAALEEFLLASLDELSVSFQGTLDTILDISDLEETKSNDQ